MVRSLKKTIARVPQRTLLVGAGAAALAVGAGAFFLIRRGASVSVSDSSVAACRAAIPVDPGLKPTGAMLGGHFYSGQDAAHVAWLKDYLARRAASESGEAKRGTLAFAALQGREGSTAAVNTYDNQVFTWGTGWGGLGGLPMVMNRLVSASPAVVAKLAACGVKYTGNGSWAIDDGKGTVVTGKTPALQVIRGTPALMNLFIHLAKDPATREAVADAQLGAFLASSGTFAGSNEVATQALYNFVAHLKHWAPGFVAVDSAAAGVPGGPSEDRDRALAAAVVRVFYDKAPAKSYVRTGWKQLQGYALRDMKADGLDVGGDPLFTASEPPSKGIS